MGMAETTWFGILKQVVYFSVLHCVLVFKIYIFFQILAAFQMFKYV